MCGRGGAGHLMVLVHYPEMLEDDDRIESSVACALLGYVSITSYHNYEAMAPIKS